MGKIGLLKNDKMGEYELEKGYASYKTIVERYIQDIVLCNNIVEIDESILENMEGGIIYYNVNNHEEITEDEYINGKGDYDIEYPEIYQYYLCHITDYEKETLLKSGFILSYSNILECDVLCVDHLGTSWDYVLTNVKLFDTYEELEKYEEEK